MSVPRACLPCRQSKARCDQARPACGRCRQRAIVCPGYSTAPGAIFRDERDAAQRNSERARSGRRQRGPPPVTELELQSSRPSPGPAVTAIADNESVDLDLQQQLWWLNDFAVAGVPEPLKKDPCVRAVDRFFVNWTVHPDNDGVSLGYMQDLPLLYHDAPEDCVLWLAVRAVAFADVKNARDADNVPFNIKARRRYGEALFRMREVVSKEEKQVDDRVLAALLLIDNFELLYLARREPLGPHSEAVRHLLRARGNDQLYAQNQFCLWCIAHQRLQTRQIMLREEPSAEQLEWMSKLNTNRPDLRMSADVMQMSVLCAAARHLTEPGTHAQYAPEGLVHEANTLVDRIQQFLATVQDWMSAMGEVWKPRIMAAAELRPDHGAITYPFPFPHFACPRALTYQDVWLAQKFNFHAASLIILRESLSDVVMLVPALQGRNLNFEETALIQAQKMAVEELTGRIIESFPALLGLAERSGGSGTPELQQGRMAGRFFLLSSMQVMQRARFAIPDHKQTAAEVIEWIGAAHTLG